ncbi:MAG: hypothetical protein PHW95_02040 [Patescibacteria group bacterium]|nr:hypothetical protein [Patescibacteria group bacterium]
MSRPQPVHEMLSLFGFNAQANALSQKIAKYRLAISLLSAFFIVLAVAFLMNISENVIKAKAVVPSATIEERAAFIPGHFISDKISLGYLGSYR